MSVKVSQQIKDQILEFVDSTVPGDNNEVWLTGSRVRGDAGPISDWDVVVFTPDMNRKPEALFFSNQINKFTIDDGKIELVIAHPDHWNDPRAYMAEVRDSGMTLR